MLQVQHWSVVAAVAVAVAASRGSANGRNSRIKKRKIENETASCRVTVRLHAETRTGGARDGGGTRIGADFPRP